MGLGKKLQLDLHAFKRVKKEPKINIPFYNYRSHQNPTTYYIFISVLQN